MALKLWSKLEDAGDVTAPQIGTGGAEVGSPTYAAAKFNNGIQCDAGNEGCTFPTAANSISGLKGTLEFWAKMLYASTNGAPNYKDMIYSVGARRIRINWKTDVNRLMCEVGPGFVVEKNIVFALNELVHIGLVWDGEGNDIGGGKTAALYVNGVEVDSVLNTWTAGDLNTNLQVGYRDASYYAVCIIDNLKYYEECKTDFSDRNDEGAGANQVPTAPTSLEDDLQSTPTGANCVTTTPLFTAIFNDPDAGDISNAINIQVGTASGLSDKWDSGWLADSTVDGNRCDAKTYAGAALSAGTSYWWRCRFRDDDNEEGAWSAWQQFDVCAAEEEVGLLECTPGGPLPKRCPFRCAVALPRRVPSWLY